MGLKQVVKQRQGYVKGKLKGVSKDKAQEVIKLLEQNHSVNELIEELSKFEIFNQKELSDIKKHFEKIDLTNRLR